MKSLKMNIPWIESPFAHEILKNKNLSEEYTIYCKHFIEHGFVVIKKLLPDGEADEIVNDIQSYFPKNIDLDTNRQQDLWSKSQKVEQLAVNPKVLDILTILYDKTPFPFQTLNFKYGSQQRIHSDSIHFYSIPERFMCGVWAALEETNTQNGPLLYYPGSHKEPFYNYQDIGIGQDNPGNGDGLKKGGGYTNYGQYEDFIQNLIETKGYEEKELHLDKGDILIWSSNLLHGGKKVLDLTKTRWSQVTHYYFENCIYYTPMWSNMDTHELFLREPFDIKAKVKIQGKLDQKEPKKLFAGNSRYFLSNKIDPSLLMDLKYKDFSVVFKDRLKQLIKKK